MPPLNFFCKLPYKSCLFVFLIELMNYKRFYVFGDIGIGEICILIYILFKFKPMTKDKFVKDIGRLYVLLLSAQLFSEIFVSNGLNDSIRNVMVTIMSFCHLTFLLHFFKRDYRNIVFGLLGMSVYILLLPVNMDESALIESIANGTGAAYVKMRLAPALGFIMSAVALLAKKNISVIIFIFAGAFLIISGARNGGMTVMLAAVAAIFLFGKTRKLSLKKMALSLTLVSCVCYVLYIIYVDEVQSGFIQSGNNHRVLDLDNPYNPFELIYKNRTEFFVGLHAFLDHFFFGMGGWAKDVTGQYWMLLHKLSGDGSTFVGVWMPVHSVLMGWGVYNGVLAFVAGLRIVFFLIKKFIFVARHSQYSRYSVTLCYMFFAFLWNLLFSPPSHFRLFLPVYMATIFAIYINSLSLLKAKDTCLFGKN